MYVVRQAGVPILVWEEHELRGRLMLASQKASVPTEGRNLDVLGVALV